jgi:hypothetical protein
MPTLMPTAAPMNPPPVPLSPAALTLSFGGVEFALTPSDNAAEVSYKTNGQGVVLSLTSFTGSLQISMRGGIPTILSTTAKVEEEPHSPDVTPEKLSVFPGQQKLSFSKPNNKANTATKKKTETKPKKRSVDTQVSRPSGKKSRTTKDMAVVKAPEAPAAPPSLCQTMDPTQATQETPDLSQTMPSSHDQSGTDERGSSMIDSEMFRIQSIGSREKPKTSVQEILDRVNGSNDSVATVRGDDNDDDDDEHSIATNNGPEKPSGLVEEKTDPNEKENVPSTTALVPNNEETNTALQGHPFPSPRWGHTMTKLKGERLLIYGGQSFDLQGDPIILSDVHVYDIANRTWNKPINCRGEARQWHSATFLPERQLLISFGGETLVANKKNKVVTSNSLKVSQTLSFIPAFVIILSAPLSLTSKHPKLAVLGFGYGHYALVSSSRIG